MALALVAVAVTVTGRWLTILSSSLWLDETGTVWVVSDGLGDSIDRARFQGQTGVYYVVAWLARQALGESELALRVPSLLAMLVAVFLVYRLGRRIVDTEAGLLAAVVVGVMPQIVFSATGARPYALALATATGSMLALLGWIEDGRRSALVAWILTTAATVYLSYMFALVVVLQLVVVVGRRREPRVRALAPASVVVALLLVPAIPHALDLLSTEGLLTWAREGVSPRRLVLTILPLWLVAGVAIGVAGARLGGPLGYAAPRGRRRMLIPLAAWAIVPPVAFFLLGLALSPKLFQPRYYLLAAPGIGLAAGWLIRGFHPVRARALAAAGLVLLAVLAYDDTRQGRQDWRAAAATVNRLVEDPQTLVLFHSGFATRRTEGPGAELVLAPAIAYPMEGELIALPFDITPETTATMQRIAERARQSDRFLLVQSFDVAPFREWLRQRLQGDGYSVTTVFDTRNLQVDVFDRALR